MADLSCSLEYGPVLAVAVPQANPTVEPEMQALLSQDNSLLTARMTSLLQDSRARLIDYFDKLSQTLDQFDVAPVQVAGFACTGSSYLVGLEEDQLRLGNLTSARGYPVIGAAQAIKLALQTLGARRIALLSPYPDWLSAAGQAYWRACGFDLGPILTLPQELLDTRNIYGLRSRSVLEIFDQIDTSLCDAVLLSGTGMPTLRVIAQRYSSVPILSSNLCLAWAMRCATAVQTSHHLILKAMLDPKAQWRSEIGSCR